MDIILILISVIATALFYTWACVSLAVFILATIDVLRNDRGVGLLGALIGGLFFAISWPGWVIIVYFLAKSAAKVAAAASKQS